MSRILTVSGSPSVVSRSAKLLDHVSRSLVRSGHDVTHLNLRDLPAEALLHARFDDPAIIEAARQLELADGVVVATPVYKAAYTGLLKAWLDLLPQYALTDKTVLPLATGGSVAHALALDYGLRPVLSSMGARHIVQGFLVVDRYLETSPTGVLTIDAEVQPGLTAVVDGFLAALPAPVVARLSA
ncbi:NADPH-dependent FMN reductase [Terrabacter sp. MAHUQ-38]|uniref:NADPH-dependent FMN reductase n=1 Tax=unclassified Terrabacter TaxID=2630222 RepID=UPI00165DE199|nr:NADPH-dependent FMN reductase [Terrabacter sp. MAHUQ-38]MBC9824169.1 NADPH-dependent FMN reductase [Terrabacter sp. MAHUQ-38]